MSRFLVSLPRARGSLLLVLFGASAALGKDGKAVFAVFHDEDLTIDANTDLNELAFSANWRLWGAELDGKMAAPLPGIDKLAGGYSVVNVDDRTFLMVPSANYASTGVHEIDATGGVQKRFEIPGDSYQILKLH